MVRSVAIGFSIDASHRKPSARRITDFRISATAGLMADSVSECLAVSWEMQGCQGLV